MKKSFLFLFLILIQGYAFANLEESSIIEERIQNIIIPPIDFTCIAVQGGGDVTLNWTPSVASGGVFVEYQLFCLQSGALPIATFANINTASFTHNGAGADLQSVAYYMVTVSDCNGVLETSYSDTISSIFLEINDLGDGRVFVEWNPTHQPQLAGESLNYQILREYPAGTWQLRKSIPYGEFNFRDTIDVCSGFMNYKIEVNHNSGCKSESNIEGDIFQDIINPYIPVVSHVTVDTLSQNAIIYWNQNQAPDTYGYIILKLVNGFWENIDTVYGIGTTSYTDFGSIEDVQSETYAVAAFDSCIVNNVPPNYQTSAASNSHSTIFLASDFNVCDLKMQINWTSYVGWSGSDPITGYEVLVKKGNDNYQVVGNLSTQTTGFTYSGLQVNEKYCFIVRAISSSGLHSYSNQICKFIIPPTNPSFHYLSMASHTLSESLELEFYTDAAANAVSYEIYKKGPRDFDFSILHTIEPNGSTYYNYFDTDVAERGVYEYKVGIIDSCGNTNVFTAVTQTIYLILDKEDQKNTLSWTDYEGFEGQITEYRIYRGEDGNYAPTPIQINPPGVRSFTDDLTNEFDSEGGFCYRVEAIESGNKYGFKRTAFSNEVCTTLDPIVFVPSAIVLNGVNDEFKPVIKLYDFDTYQMEIFNRWGENIFITDNIVHGWKGTAANGGDVNEGIFVYRITFKDVEGKRYEKTGTVAVLRNY